MTYIVQGWRFSHRGLLLCYGIVCDCVWKGGKGWEGGYECVRKCMCVVCVFVCPCVRTCKHVCMLTRLCVWVMYLTTYKIYISTMTSHKLIVGIEYIWAELLQTWNLFLACCRLMFFVCTCVHNSYCVCLCVPSSVHSYFGDCAFGKTNQGGGSSIM